MGGGRGALPEKAAEKVPFLKNRGKALKALYSRVEEKGGFLLSKKGGTFCYRK